ncbi:MAG: DUF433 domain-containing protein [Acidobacteria bacterium]|nr:DUF433 domain-containing protein [Acidobacteriota bacterium]
MGGKPRIGGMRITVGTIVGLPVPGRTVAEVLAATPLRDTEDIRQALRYAAWRGRDQVPGSARPKPVKGDIMA